MGIKLGTNDALRKRTMSSQLTRSNLKLRLRRLNPAAVLLVVLLTNISVPLTSGETLSVLVYSRTTGFRHDSIPAGIQAIQGLGAAYGFSVVASEDPTIFSDTALAQFDAVVFLQTTGNPLEGAQRSAFERFIESGKGFVGIHAASDVDGTWPWYVQLLGAQFAGHPAIQTAAINVVDPTHPSTTNLDNPWQRTDEWYNFQNLSPNIHVLLNLNESTYNGGTMGANHPTSWFQQFAAGRSWYTGGGHTVESYQEADFLQHLAGGILWAAVRAGDYNRDGAVDGADYVVWRRTLGDTGLGLPADGDGDQEVGPQDYQLWRANFAPAIVPGASPTAPNAVPEASTFIELVLAICTCAIALRHSSMTRVSW
jgi:uncharacterized protein